MDGTTQKRGKSVPTTKRKLLKHKKRDFSVEFEEKESTNIERKEY